MQKVYMVTEKTPIHLKHVTYHRECRYTRGIHIPLDDFLEIVGRMHGDTKVYFEFHNVAVPIEKGSYLNGHASLATVIDCYYRNEKQLEIVDLTNGKDFYVLLI